MKSKIPHVDDFSSRLRHIGARVVKFPSTGIYREIRASSNDPDVIRLMLNDYDRYEALDARLVVVVRVALQVISESAHPTISRRVQDFLMTRGEKEWECSLADILPTIQKLLIRVTHNGSEFCPAPQGATPHTKALLGGAKVILIRTASLLRHLEKCDARAAASAALKVGRLVEQVVARRFAEEDVRKARASQKGSKVGIRRWTKQATANKGVARAAAKKILATEPKLKRRSVAKLIADRNGMKMETVRKYISGLFPSSKNFR